jgi:hypothetical protein
MEKITKNEAIIHWENIKPIEFERILSLYGMKKQDYCNLRSKSKCWWHNVLIKKQFLTYLDAKMLADEIGIETFNMLLAKVREQQTQ